MDCPERAEDVRLRAFDMVDDARDGPWLVLEVDVVEVEGVRRDKGAALLLLFLLWAETVDWVDVREYGT